MKKIIMVLLAFLLAFELAGCDKKPKEDDKVHLIVLAGQSGARGKALVKDLDEEQRETNADVDIIVDGLTMGELSNIPDEPSDMAFVDSLNSGLGDFPSEFGPELGIGQTLASRYPKVDQDYKSVIVKYTASGSTFKDHWYSKSALEDQEVASVINDSQVKTTKNDELTGPLTNNLYQLIDMAIDQITEQGYEVVIDGAAFVHGEQDAKFDDNMEIYEKCLRYFIDDLREYVGNKSMPVIITEALTNSAKYSNNLRQIQANVSNEMENVTLIKTWDLFSNTFEPWHFGANSNMVLGNRIAAELISHNDTRKITSIDEEVINVPYGVEVELPKYIKASFSNYYSGYVKVEEIVDNYDPNKLGLQDVTVKVNSIDGLVKQTIKVNVKDDASYVDGVFNEYASKNAINLPNSLGSVYVVKGEEGLYITANINDTDIWTDGEEWHKGDMGQKNQNDDFRIYLTTTNAKDRHTICLSSANLLRVYDKGISLNDTDIVLETNNLVYKNKINDYKYRVTTKGTVNDNNKSNGAVYELYIPYEELSISNPDSLKLCFNYVNVSGSSKEITSNYIVNGNATSNCEETDSYYISINDLI